MYFQRLFRNRCHDIVCLMKKELVVGIILIAIFGAMVGYYVDSYNTKKTPGPAAEINLITNQTALTASIIAEHSTQNDCWIIVQGKIYNVTSYLINHPGGAGEITPFCGQEATLAFQTKNDKGAHSQAAYDMLAPYFIGDLAGANTNTNSANGNLENSNADNSNTNNGSLSPINSVSGIALTAAEVAKHASSADCWFIYNTSVYNLTAYLSSHPGGASQITPFCGKDATAAMNTKAGQGTHSSQAFADLAAYIIGTLNSTVDNGTIVNTNQPPPGGNRNIGEDDEDDENEDENDE